MIASLGNLSDEDVVCKRSEEFAGSVRTVNRSDCGKAATRLELERKDANAISVSIKGARQPSSASICFLDAITLSRAGVGSLG